MSPAGKKKALLLIVPLLIVLSGCAPSSPRNIKNLYTAGGTTLVCFGDSLTSGLGAPKGMDYPSFLRKDLRLPVINAGIPGDTTRSGLARLGADALSKDPKIVIVELGANDLLPSAGRGPAVAAAFSNLGTIIDRIQEKGAVAVLAGININRDVDRRYRELAKKKGAAYVPDIMEGIVDDPGLMSDAMHPNGRGYEKMAAKFSAVLRPLLKEME